MKRLQTIIRSIEDKLDKLEDAKAEIARLVEEKEARIQELETTLAELRALESSLQKAN